MKSSGEALSVSYTVATLDARSKMARMRMLLSRPGYQDGDALREAIAAELDNLTDVLTDAYKRVDGMVDDESYCSRVEQLQSDLEDAEKQATEEEEKRSKSRTRSRRSTRAASSPGCGCSCRAATRAETPCAKRSPRSWTA